MTKLKLIQFIFWFSCFGVLLLSLLPGENIPSVFNFWDKAQHAVAFAILAIFGLSGYRQHWLRIGFGLLIFGAFIELAQAFTSWRYGDIIDWIADAIGVTIVFVIAAWGKFRQTK